MLHGLPICDGKGAEPNFITHACYYTASCVDYPDDMIFRAERKGVRPDEQMLSPRYNHAFANANGVIDLYSVLSTWRSTRLQRQDRTVRRRSAYHLQQLHVPGSWRGSTTV